MTRPSVILMDPSAWRVATELSPIWRAEIPIGILLVGGGGSSDRNSSSSADGIQATYFGRVHPMTWSIRAVRHSSQPSAAPRRGLIGRFSSIDNPGWLEHFLIIARMSPHGERSGPGMAGAARPRIFWAHEEPLMPARSASHPILRLFKRSIVAAFSE